MKILAFQSDGSGCYIYRLRIPGTELRRFGAEIHCLPFLPNSPGETQMNTLIRLMEEFQIIVIQRCYRLALVSEIKKAAEFLGKPCIFETDDDYLNLPHDNPAYFSIIDPSKLTSTMTVKELEALRAPALEEYKKIIQMMDGVTVSTEELKLTLNPYNKNIQVFQNNVLGVYKFRTYDSEESMRNADGNIVIKDTLGMVSVPNYHIKGNNLAHSVRIGYSCTPSHKGQDWNTISDMWERLISEYSKKNVWFVYIGADPGPQGNYQTDYFYNQHFNLVRTKRIPNRAVPIRVSEYEFYNFHLRNLDVGICPLAGSTRFNDAKSDLKLIEYGAWGVPGIAPNVITYNRNFVHGETAMLYNNAREFHEYSKLLINDHKLRYDMGQKALAYVESQRLEKLPHNCERRYNFYKSMIDKSYPLKIHQANKELVNV